MKTRIFLTIWLAAGMAGFFTVTSAQESSNRDQLRNTAETLRLQAQRLKEEGQGEKATALVKGAEKLNQLAANAEKQPNAKRANKVKPPRDVRNEINELRARLKELESAGKMDQGEKGGRRFGESEDRFGPDQPRKELRERNARNPGMQEQMAGPRRFERPRPARRPGQEAIDGRETQRPEGRPGAPSPENGDAQMRLRHLMAAVENLHAAGLHEPAENLSRQAEQMRQHLSEATGPMPSRGAGPDGNRNRDGREQFQGRVPELQGEIMALRQAVDELRKRLDELTRERR